MKFLILSVIALMLCAGARTQAAGFQLGQTSPFENAALEIAVWSPSAATPREETFGPFHQTVARDAEVRGERLPLIVISHGTGGSSLGHYDTAIALADAGFVVVAVTHAGDNFKDRSASFTSRILTSRAHQIGWVIDHMTRTWTAHEKLDVSRMGIFGHSAGGATALILMGGEIDTDRLAAFCRENPNDWGCRNERQSSAGGYGRLKAAARDPRIKAAVVAAAALGHGFTSESLAAVRTPVQLWSASADVIVAGSAAIGPRLGGPRDDRVAENAGHFSFLAPCDAAFAARAPEICQDPAGFDRPRFLREFQQSMIAFFRAHL